MIFVTVGTHEQPFNRLISAVDEIKIKKLIDDEIVIQSGYSTYKPKACTCIDFCSYDDMVAYVNEARIVITHGGPASFFMPLRVGKVPIVVPRMKKYGEHVNDHQLDFCNAVQNKPCNIIVVDDVEKLCDVILSYDTIVSGMPAEMKSHNDIFCSGFKKIVDELNIR